MNQYIITNKKTKESVKAYLGKNSRWDDEEYFIFENMAFNQWIAFSVNNFPKGYVIKLIEIGE